MSWDWAVALVCLAVAAWSVGVVFVANGHVNRVYATWEKELKRLRSLAESMKASEAGCASHANLAVARREREIVAAIDAVAVEYIGAECVAVHNALMDLRNMVERKESEPVEVTS